MLVSRVKRLHFFGHPWDGHLTIYICKAELYNHVLPAKTLQEDYMENDFFCEAGRESF